MDEVKLKYFASVARHLSFTKAAEDLHVVQSGEALRSAVICFYLSNEGVSVLENAGHLGLPIPEKLKAILAQLHDRIEEPDGTEDGGE